MLYGYNGDNEAWRDAVRIGKVFAIFLTIVTIVWGVGALVLAIRSPVEKW